MPIRRRTLLALLASAALPLAAGAQTAAVAPDSLHFHAGQWGAEFLVGYTFGGLGAPRFHSPRAAWTIDVSGRGSHDKDHNRSAGDSNDGTTSTFAASLQLGHRWYRPVARAVAVYVGTGLTASTSQSNLDAVDYSTAATSNLFGAFGNLGGTYFVTPHLGLSGGVRFDAGYTRDSYDVSNSTSDSHRHSSGYLAQLGSTTLIASLFF